MLPRMKFCWGGNDTGRRFLGCPKVVVWSIYDLQFVYLFTLTNTYYPLQSREPRCNFIQWKDDEWPQTAQLGMNQLWAEIKKLKKAARKARVQRDEAQTKLEKAEKALGELKVAMSGAQKKIRALGLTLAKGEVKN